MTIWQAVMLGTAVAGAFGLGMMAMYARFEAMLLAEVAEAERRGVRMGKDLVEKQNARAYEALGALDPKDKGVVAHAYYKGFDDGWREGRKVEADERAKAQARAVAQRATVKGLAKAARSMNGSD